MHGVVKYTDMSYQCSGGRSWAALVAARPRLPSVYDEAPEPAGTLVPLPAQLCSAPPAAGLNLHGTPRLRAVSSA